MFKYRLTIPRPLYERMLERAAAELPNECCGILAGVFDERGVARVSAVLPLINELASPRAFRSEPLSHFHAQRTIRAAEWKELAIYHSHPTSDPIPSKQDLADNYSPDVMNLIISLKDEVPRVHAWWLAADGYREAEWDVTDNAG